MGKPSDKFKEASQSVETPQRLKPTPERNDIATENSFQLQELPVNSTPITNVSITNNEIIWPQIHQPQNLYLQLPPC